MSNVECTSTVIPFLFVSFGGDDVTCVSYGVSVCVPLKDPFHLVVVLNYLLDYSVPSLSVD